MVRVCTKIYPKGFSHNIKDGFWMNDNLKAQLDILAKNIIHDWDFTIIISGGGEVRVGKPVLAMQIAAYWKYLMKKIHNKEVSLSVKKNFIFDGNELIKTGNELGEKYPYSQLIYDEAGADLQGKKIMTRMTQNVIDFYRECGQYNLLNILVIPDFFDLPKGLALTRSIFLLDVYYTHDENDLFIRGYFDFFSRKAKKYLYLNGKRNLDYNAASPEFSGRFYNFYPIDEQEYRNVKKEALRKREVMMRGKFQKQRDACWYLLNREIGWTQQSIAERMRQLTGIHVTQQTIADGVRHFKMENE